MKKVGFWVLSVLLCSSARGTTVDFRSGDLIFQTSKTLQSKVIQKATRSPFSHVGIVEVTEDGRKFVIEAVHPVSRNDLGEWIQRGIGGKYAVYRDPELSAAKASEFIAAAKWYLGRGYDNYFTQHNEEIYCSELVDYAARAVGIVYGRYQRFGSLDVRNQEVMALVRERWKGHPLCKELQKFEDCWPRIEDDQMITPVSLTKDEKLKILYSNY